MKTDKYNSMIMNFLYYLQTEEERSKNTILQYEKSLRSFKEFLEANEIEEITKEVVTRYKNEMLEEIEQNKKNNAKPIKGKRPIKSYNTLNLRIRTLNALFDYAGEPELKTKKKKTVTANVNSDTLTETDYLKLLEYIDKYSNPKIKLIVETLANTGIRISELEAITVNSLKSRTTEVDNKGKVRNIFIPKGLTKKLREYCKENNITDGIIFKNRAGDGMISQTYIRDELKRVAGLARMKKSSVHPHNFRHLFAQRYASMPNNNAYVLPDLLGHSNGGINSITSLYTRLDAKQLLKHVDTLETYVNKEILPEAQKKRDVNKRKAELKKQKNRSKK